jgi:hypothetical protein
MLTTDRLAGAGIQETQMDIGMRMDWLLEIAGTITGHKVFVMPAELALGR